MRKGDIKPGEGEGGSPQENRARALRAVLQGLWKEVEGNLASWCGETSSAQAQTGVAKCPYGTFPGGGHRALRWGPQDN